MATKWSKYGKKYNPDWERERELKDWIRPVTGDNSKALHADLKQHASTEKHRWNAKPFSSSRLTDLGFSVVKPSTKSQVTELRLTTYVACHTSIRCIDCLGEIIGTDCDMDMSIHRTKCEALIKNVVAPCMFNDLLKDIGESRYSLIIDESTDISSIKQLCAAIR